MDEVRRRTGIPSSGATFLQPRANCQAVEFIEFAVDEDDAAGLRNLFAGMGFTERGRHVSKDVEWWRQGEVNLIVNAEKEGFAHASYLTHGPGVCAVGLRVADAPAAVARATALLARPFAPPASARELVIPAIRGVGGSLIYVVDRKSELADIWEKEFRSEPADRRTSSNGAGILAVDHVSQSMEYDEMLSWLLFYTSIFNLEKMPEAAVADPAGLVGSRVVQTADGAVRFTLNASRSHRTLSGRFLNAFFGSGVQHVAFATSDILHTAATLRNSRVKLLPIPANYYDDLEARFGLAGNLLDEMKSAGVLYDRDDSGEYFQLYTVPFADRFFFEIVERRGGYYGFGAPNAPIRLAAQARLSRHPMAEFH